MLCLLYASETAQLSALGVCHVVVFQAFVKNVFLLVWLCRTLPHLDQLEESLSGTLPTRNAVALVSSNKQLNFVPIRFPTTVCSPCPFDVLVPFQEEGSGTETQVEILATLVPSDEQQVYGGSRYC